MSSQESDSNCSNEELHSSKSDTHLGHETITLTEQDQAIHNTNKVKQENVTGGDGDPDSEINQKQVDFKGIKQKLNTEETMSTSEKFSDEQTGNDESINLEKECERTCVDASICMNSTEGKASDISSQYVNNKTKISQDKQSPVKSVESKTESVRTDSNEDEPTVDVVSAVPISDTCDSLNLPSEAGSGSSENKCDNDKQNNLHSKTNPPENIVQNETNPPNLSPPLTSPPKLLRENSDELLTELESELQNNTDSNRHSKSSANNIQLSADNSINKLTEQSNKEISCETDSEKNEVHISDQNVGKKSSSNENTGVVLPNGVIPQKNVIDIPEYKDLSKKYEKLHRYYIEKEMDVKRLSDEVRKLSDELCKTVKDRDVRIKKIEDLENNSPEKKYLAKISELENIIAKETNEHKETKVRLASHDAAAKKAVQQIQNETQAKIAQINKAYEECKRDKEGMTVKYAMAEQKNLELQEKMTRNERKVREMERERDNVIGRYKQMKTEKEKSDGNVLARGQEIVNLRREIEKLKEIRTDLESKTKWANSKLKTELESHKEDKAKFEDVNKKYRQLREESEQVRKDCQSMIKEYQQNEEVKSITLAVKLDQKEQALQQQQQEKTDQEEVHMVVRNELDKLKRRHKEMVEELKTYKDKVTCLESERLLQEETLNKFKETLQTQKQANRDLYDRIAVLEKAEVELNNAKSEVQNLTSQVSDFTENNKDLKVDIDACAKREAGHLEFSKRVSDKNAKLQAENSTLSNKLSTLQHEFTQMSNKCKNLEEKIKELEEALEEEKHQRIEENGSLSAKVEEKTRKVEELSQDLEDQKDENKTLKRRHQANVKDLTRQLQQAKRKLDNNERRSGDGASMGSMGSRTSSTNSINTVGENGSHGRGGSQEPHHPLPQEDEQPIVQFVEVDKQILVEKIVKLQRLNARKSEKLEFMEDHINQLIEELQKKHKIIQHYALREETGALAPQEMDLNKAQLSKKSGIMASIYKRHVDDAHMSMDLLLEINRKLQAVLEDTLLKNITLKDNMDTLGKEIANISHNNRTLQLELHKIKETTTKS